MLAAFKTPWIVWNAVPGFPVFSGPEVKLAFQKQIAVTFMNYVYDAPLPSPPSSLRLV